MQGAQDPFNYNEIELKQQFPLKNINGKAVPDYLSNEFEAISPFGDNQTNAGVKNELKKTMMKLSFLNQAKRNTSSECSNIRNCIFNLIHQHFNTDPALVKICIEFMLNDRFSNRILLELDINGKIKNSITNLVGFSSLVVENENLESIFKNFTIDQLNDLVVAETFVKLEMIPCNIGQVEIFICPGTNSDYLLLLRY